MLKGNKVSLRAIKYEDLVHLNSWRNDLRNKILVQGFRLPVPEALDELWYKEKVLTKDNKNIYFIVEINSSKKAIGLIQLNNIDYISGTTECGLIIGSKDERGKGNEIEALRLIFKFAFSVLNLRKVVSYTLNIRPGMQRFLNRISKVRLEGVLKEQYFFNGIYYDIQINSFFREDFQNLKYDKSFI
jgi:RimJ/RimL family protein N-acetyltransferase